MHPIWVILAYGCAIFLALELLHQFHARAWYWHALSVAAALGLGLVRLPEQFAGPTADLIIGSLFVFLVVWGLAAPLFRKHRRIHLEKHA
jgi:hypothetical protein